MKSFLVSTILCWMMLMITIDSTYGLNFQDECKITAALAEPWAIVGCGPRDGAKCTGSELYELINAMDPYGALLGARKHCPERADLVYWTLPLANLTDREVMCRRVSQRPSVFDPKIVICSIETKDWTTTIVSVVTTVVVLLTIAGVIFVLWKCGKLERCSPSRKQKPNEQEQSPRANGPLLEEHASDDDLIPHFVRKRIQLMEEMGLAKGIHRVHWNDPEAVTILDRSLEADPFLRADQLDWSITPHTVANSLDEFLRTLREPVIPRTIQSQVPSIMVLESHKDRKRMVKEALVDLPSVNHATLRFLIGHLRFVTERQDITHMDQPKIAAVFQPILMDDWRRPGGEESEKEAEVKFIEMLLKHPRLLLAL